MLNYLINQPAGIGDIIFCQKIGKQYALQGPTYWPVAKEISYIKDYIIFSGFEEPKLESKAVVYELWGERKEGCNTVLINLCIADRYHKGSVMEAKYFYVADSFHDWSEHVTFVRNTKKEQELYNKLNPNNEEYVLVSKYIGTPPGHREIPIKINTDKKIIEVSLIDGFNPFDWCLLLENASEIHMVDTCFNYIMELINIKTKKLHLYSRFYPNTNFSHIENLFKLPWEYHTHI